MDSQGIINTMEVLETKPITDLVSESVIKVCYVSDKPNPNRTVINYEIGKEIAASLPGAPVVGFFDKETGDFEQHSRRITISDGEVHIEDITKPYGFVSPMHQPWYQDFTEDGEIRTYLMCRAYLWTRQYEEAKLAFGKGQSMELDEHSMSGYYEGDVFVFTSATLDKLCILGDDYPPCFSGASIMSTYAKEYDSLAENIQNAIGRRYYIMNGQVKETPATPVAPEQVTLEYALELGWNLNEAIYRQLDSRGFAGKYSIEGVYREDGTIFTVLRDCETMEYLRCDVTITSDEKVEMATEFTAVSPTFVPKAPATDTGVPSLGNDPVPTPADPTTNNTASDPVFDPEPATPPEGAGNFEKKKKKENEEGSSGSGGDDGSSGGSTDDKKKDEEGSNKSDGNSGGNGEGDSGSSDDEEKKKKKPATKNAKKDDEDKDEDDDDEFKKKKNCAEGDGTEPEADPPAIDFAARIAELEAQLEAANTSIASMTEELNAYKLKDEEALKAQKETLISSYSEMLSEEEVKDVKEHMNEYSLEDIESKLAVTYTRKVREAKKTESLASGIQVNVNSFNSQSDNLPDYLKDALEYDQSRRLHLQ